MKMRATQNFAHGADRGEQWVWGGAEYDSTDPIVLAFPVFFEPIEEPPQETPAPPPKRRRNG